MKKTILTIVIAGFFTLGLTMLASCGGSSEKEHEHTESEGAHEQMNVEGEDHEEMGGDESMDMDMGDKAELAVCPKWKDGDHKHATYVCPMWEEEGELEEAGDCPKCGMTLLTFDDIKEQHDSQKP